MKKLLSLLLSIVLLLTVMPMGAVTLTVNGAIDYVFGDINSDSAINNKDLGLLMQYLNTWKIANFDCDAADVNDDDIINNKDYGLLLQYINNWDVKLGEQPIVPPSTNNKFHTPLSTDEYYQYTSLNATQKKIYNDVLSAIKETRNIIDVSKYDISFEEGCLIFEKVMADYPEFFFVSKYVSAMKNPNTNKPTALFIYYTDGETVDKLTGDGELVVTASRKNIANQIKQFNNKTEQVLKTIPVDCEDIVKEKIIHDWIVDNTTYDYDSVDKIDTQFGDAIGHAWDVYGTFIEGKIVCEGYAKAFVYLCHAVGINATTVSGLTNGIEHMWNAVEIEKCWYMLDVTWNDAELDFPIYDFFNNTTEEFNFSRTTTTNLAYPTCTSTKHTYQNALAIDISNGKLPNNFKTIIDITNQCNSNWVMFWIDMDNGVETEWLFANVWNNDSPIHKYIKEKGYNFKLSSYDGVVFYSWLSIKIER